MVTTCAYCHKEIIDINDKISYKHQFYHNACYQTVISSNILQQKRKYQLQEQAKTDAMKSFYTEKELKDKKELEQYISNLFGYSILPPKVEQQIETYYSRGYSFSGMLKSLTYFFDLKGNGIQEANGGIGIIPYVYDEAKEYYYQIWLANTANMGKNLRDYLPKTKEVVITVPKRQRRNLFPILEESENDE